MNLEIAATAEENVKENLSILGAFWQNLADHAVSIALSLAGAALVLFIGFKFADYFVKKLKNGAWFHKMDVNAQSFMGSCLSVLLKAVVIVTAVAILGVPLTAVVTVLGSAGLAIGLALQGALGNFAGGIMILVFKPFKIGDYIDNHTEEGTVESIGIFYTGLITPDNRKIVVPNSTLTGSSLVNLTAMPTRRVDLEFTASYDADLDTVIDVMLSTALAHKLVKRDPAPFARLLRQDESALTFVLRVWCDSADYWTIRFDLMENMKRNFDKTGISIPYPQLDVHMIPAQKQDDGN